MKNIITKFPLISFFLMAFVLSWVLVIPKIVIQNLPVEPFLILGAFAGPTLSSIIIIAVTEGKTGLGRFFKRYLQWKAGLVWWLISLFGILIALNIVATIILGPSILTDFAGYLGAIFPTYLMALIFGVILGPLWEEPGWRGFALPRLQEQYGALAGSVILGVLAYPRLSGWLDGSGLPCSAHFLYRIFHHGNLGLQQYGWEYSSHDPAPFIQ